MFRVKITPQAEALFGRIQKRASVDPERLDVINRAFLSALTQLSNGGDWLFLVDSDNLSDCFELYEPPLMLVFKKADHKTLVVVNVQDLKTK